MQKENPNPIIHTTHNKRSHPSHSSSVASPSFLGSSNIRRYHLCSPSPPSSSNSSSQLSVGIPVEYMPWGSITAEDRSVALALSAAAYHNNNPSTSSTTTPPSSAPSSSTTESEIESPKLELLQQAGFALFHPRRITKQCNAIRYPSYSPTSSSSPVHTKEKRPSASEKEQQEELSHSKRDTITIHEIFDIVRTIQDPEHPLTLEQLNVVRAELIEVFDEKGKTPDDTDDDGDSLPMRGKKKKKFSTVRVQFTPTIPHCSMATLIGLSLRVKLLRSIPPRFKVVVQIEDGTHVSEHAVNKQLADKERVRAALENDHLLGVVNRCIEGGMLMQ